VRALVVLAAVGLLAGCTTQFDIGGGEWTKPGALVPQVTQDEMECARTAVDARPFPDTIVGGVADVVAATLQDVKMSRDFERCMAGKGYQPARSQG
jgi:hypothetical protein